MIAPLQLFFCNPTDCMALMILHSGKKSFKKRLHFKKKNLHKALKRLEKRIKNYPVEKRPDIWYPVNSYQVTTLEVKLAYSKSILQCQMSFSPYENIGPVIVKLIDTQKYPTKAVNCFELND